jgi:hypothetical protein
MCTSMFEAIKLLKKRTMSNNQIEIVYGNYIWTAKFEWNQPNINIDSVSFDKPLPQDYVHFVEEIANGCILFYDAAYGQWGYKIYSLTELKSKQEIWKKSLGNKWQNSFLAFAELFGEAHPLIFDLNLLSGDSNSCAILEANPIDPIDDWYKVSRSFHEWLDHLITAQGAKYWEWR